LESKFQVIIATLSICTGLFISLAISWATYFVS
jgi:hypothetical protein